MNQRRKNNMAKYCENCGVKLEETANFCTSCGEKVKIEPAKQETGNEDAALVYCPNCGKQVSKEFEFCTECGAAIQVGQKAAKPGRKKYFGKKKGAAVYALAAVALVVVVLGGRLIVKNINSHNYSKALKAYQEFYDEYYDEYSDELGKHSSFSSDDLYRNREYGWHLVDCSGKIVMKDNKPILVIADEIDLTADEDEDGDYYYVDGIFDVHFYEFDGWKVKEMVTIPKLRSWDDGFSVFTVENTIYVTTDSYANGFEGYRIDEDSYDELKVIKYGEDDEDDDRDDEVVTEIGESGKDAQQMFDYGSYTQVVFTDCGNMVIMAGDTFDDWLEYLGEQKIKSTLDLDVTLAEYLVKEGMGSDYIWSLYWKDGIYYEYRTEDECLYVDGADEGYNEYDAPESVEGYEVTWK
jgi:predicted RNA-binding Zn-ribbon protein involved in translation (DUF1610 family)